MAMAKAQNHPPHLWEMMQRLGIDPGLLPQWSLSCATALHRCQACTHRQACRNWLDAMPASVTLAPSFCPDADLFFEMQVSQPGPHAGDWASHTPLHFGRR